MGKQSRRRRRQKKTGARQRQQQQQQQSAPTSPSQGETKQLEIDKDAPFAVGTRVWFRDKSELEKEVWIRGVVDSVHNEPAACVDDTGKEVFNQRYEIVRVNQSRDDHRRDSVSHVPGLIFRDTSPWVLRFDVGDKVLCYFRGRWEPCIVARQWPINSRLLELLQQTTARPVYEVEFCSVNRFGFGFVLYHDDDESIREYPKHYRFSVGSLVTFRTSKSQPWAQGKVVEVGAYSVESILPSVYVCELSNNNNGKRTLASVPGDSDELIASIKTSPRQRLFDAIEQNCSPTHFRYLVQEFRMEVATISDQLVNKAIENGSYNALVWLNDDLLVNVNKICNENGDGLLHQIVKSNQAESFFESVSCDPYRSILLDNLTSYIDDENLNLFSKRNNQGRTFLHELVASRDKQALELVISPQNRVALMFAQYFQYKSEQHSKPITFEDESWQDTDGMSPAAIARRLGCFDMEKMIDELERFCTSLNSRDGDKLERFCTSLNSRDGQRRTVEWLTRDEFAALHTFFWMKTLAAAAKREASTAISMFASSHFRRRRAVKQRLHLLQCIRLIQAWFRGVLVRREYHWQLARRLEARPRFCAIWSPSTSLVDKTSSCRTESSWATLKHKDLDVVLASELVGDVATLVDTTEKLDKAMAQSLDMHGESFEFVENVENDSQLSLEQNEINTNDVPSACIHRPDSNYCGHIQVTGDVVKWLQRGDSKYIGFFARRVRQLAAGERSRILAKRLTGCKTLIYETYLEQQSGHRILWTKSSDGNLLIWYVAKHKDVSRLSKLIDDAENRSKRQLTSASALREMLQGADAANEAAESAETQRILLDPLGDTPLKLFDVNVDEIKKLRDPTWRPRLHLTTKEREIVETAGTVLLLGRSGTGKTCVICNRIDYDRQRAEGQPGFSQLFIARSKRLCEYVKGAVGSSSGREGETVTFQIFGDTIQSLENSLPYSKNTQHVFDPNNRMTFSRFKRDVYLPDDIDALVVWTHIRSFIKGSVEALLSADRVLVESKYLDLGKKRCRLSSEQRKTVFAIFERYNKYIKEEGLWDDCDRITALVQRLKLARVSDLSSFQGSRCSKLYVDEVQDYTQAEIAIFFYLCGPGDLFLAGDPAQSVVEGVEFRFEEVRSVAYHLYGEDRRHLIPDKPKTVHLNFRSHCGILDVAAAVLTCLFRVFPDSAKQLKEDRGLFQGPRPGVFHKVEMERLQELVSKRNGIVVLVHSWDVVRMREALNKYPLVYSIREAKGLEFKEVVLVDFFSGLPGPLHQTLWRNLLLGRDVKEVAGHPEVEGQLKLLYTAITRCIQTLFIAETSSSEAGDAFVRWLTTTTTVQSPGQATRRKEALAVKNSVDNVEKMTRTPDEWRSAGLDNAIMAESCDDLEEADGWLAKALYCFDQIGDSLFVRKARVHRQSLQFRMSVEAGTDLDAANTEKEAARLTEKLLTEKLYAEASAVCDLVLPLLADGIYREMFETQLLSKLPPKDSDA